MHVYDLTPVLSSQSKAPGVPNNCIKCKFPGHNNVSCNSIAFSPLNALLLCSAGKDNRIRFYDINEVREVKKIDTGVPLT